MPEPAQQPLSEAESTTVVLRRLSPAWAWVRDNFKLPALLAIAGIVAGAGSWLWQQQLELAQLKKSMFDPRPRLETLERDQAALRQQLDDLQPRVEQQDENWARVYGIAAEPARRRPAVARAHATR